jgi:hypothetical protein
MSDKLGALFLTAAMGPMNYAGRLIMSRKVDEALVQLAKEVLMGSVELGINIVAKEAGVPSAEVARHLPTKELRTLMDRMNFHYEISVQQWKLHTGHIGGLLDGVADLTIDNRPPDVSLCVLRLARKFRADKKLAEPLNELSEDLDAWRVLLEKCRALLETSTALIGAYHRRRALRIGAAVSVALVMLVGGGWVARGATARSRVDAALAGEACELGDIDASDLEQASSEQLARIDTMRKACETETARKQKELAERKAAADKKRKKELREKKRIAMCERLGRDMDEGTFDGGSEAPSEHADWLKRVARGELSGDDVSRDMKQLPCAGTPGAAGIERAFVRVVVSTAPGWILRQAPSNTVRTLLGSHKGVIPQDQLQLLQGHIEQLAKDAVISGNEEKMTRCLALCALEDALDLAAGQHCGAAKSIAAR